jgi:acetylornithine deacetylase/succinyl-diaminopimelate desuccinylase-like protein
VLSPSYRGLLHDTIAVTHLAAGTSVNSLPANAIGEVDVRLLPDETSGAMLARVRQAVGEDAEVEVMIAGDPAPDTSSDTELFRVLQREMENAEHGSRVAPIVGAGATDSRFFRARGIVAYGVSPFKVNYYDAGTAHGDDERIRSQFFLEGVRLTRRIVAAFCAADEGGPAAVPKR